MSLTKQDLQSIRTIVVEVVTEIVEDAIEDAKRQTAAAFAEVHTRLDDVIVEIRGVKETVDRIDAVQQSELQRNDHQDIAIARIRKSLRAA
ncbi:MAG: hypothetical protein JWL89_553 [Candidatus Saccharibacteria bacterium]|nr:hypothetical protein [Candidatus Saccharibacteria bacterium]